MHLARATGSFGPKARAAFRRSSFARAKSPSCAIAMPRSATRFNAPRGSPAESARAAAVIRESRESIRIPPHLSLPPLRCPALNIAHGNQTPSHIENGTKGDKDNAHTRDRNTRTMAEGSARVAQGGEGTHASQRPGGTTEAGTAVGANQ